MPTPLPDSAAASELGVLLRQCATGDQLAFRTIYDIQSPKLYAVALRITRQPATASDAVHDAFLQVWRNASRFDASRGSPEAWLISLVRYRALDIARRRAREVPGLEMAEQADEEPDALERMTASAEARALRACLEELEAERRQLVAMAFIDGLSHSELAERLRLPLGTVKSWIRRGLSSLRRCLEA